MLRAGPVAVALSLGLLALVASPEVATDGDLASVARAEGPTAVAVGDRLEAINDVSLQSAQIRKGSRVSVARVAQQKGSTVVDLELADGFVVRNLSMAQVRSSFRALADNPPHPGR